jgi:hypothetical protein
MQERDECHQLRPPTGEAPGSTLERFPGVLLRSLITHKPDG